MAEKIKYQIDVDTASAVRDIAKVGDAGRKAGKEMAEGFEKAGSESEQAVQKLITNLSKTATEAERTIAIVKKLGDAYGEGFDPDAASKVVNNLRQVGAEFEDIEAKAKQLADAMRQVDGVKLEATNQGLTSVSNNLGHVRDNADQSRSVMANMAGNTAQDLGELGGAVGTLGVGLGQLAEYAAEGNISLANLSKVVGPVALFSAISVGVGLFQKYRQEQAALVEDIEDMASALDDSLGSFDDYSSALDEAFNQGTASSIDVFSQKLIEMLEAAKDAGAVNDLRAALGELGFTVDDVASIFGSASQDFVGWAEALLTAKGLPADVAHEVAVLIDANDELADSYALISGNVVDGVWSQAFADQVREAIDSADSGAAAIEQIQDSYEDLQGAEGVSAAAATFLDLEASVNDSTQSLVAQARQMAILEDGTVDEIAALQNYIDLQQEAARFKPSSTTGAQAALDDEANSLAVVTLNWRTLLDAMAAGEPIQGNALRAWNTLRQELNLSEAEMADLANQRLDEHLDEIAASAEKTGEAFKGATFDLEAYRLAAAEAAATIGEALSETPDLAGALEAELNKVDKVFDGLEFDVNFEGALDEALDGLQGFGPDFQSLADNWASILNGVEVDIYGNVRADDAEFLEKVSNLRNLFQEGVVNEFEQGGLDAANAFVQSTAQAIADATGLDISEVYKLMGVGPNGEVGVLIQPSIDEAASAQAAAILDALAGVSDDPRIAALQIRMLTDPTYTPQQAAADATALAQEWANDNGLVIPTEADPAGAEADADDISSATYDPLTVPSEVDKAGGETDVKEFLGVKREPIKFLISLLNIIDRRQALTDLAAPRTTSITISLANGNATDQELNRIARDRTSDIYVRTHNAGGGGGGGGGGGTGIGPDLNSVETQAFPTVETTATEGPALFAAPMAAESAAFYSSGGGVATLAPPVINETYNVSISAGVIGNRFDVQRAVSKAMRSARRVNGKRNT